MNDEMNDEMKIPAHPTQKEYERARMQHLLAFCPEIYPCKTCGWPVISGYVCTICGDRSPRE